ncbi:TfpX/TfpZ family type IV pilin accessory protein [Acinetobacter junii]|uniref:TfpX/TfpZ family type IV pilin accessory protein n=1 Tax=Acinetobacter junii TaxID=40215 RepID=UPI00403DCC20
MFLVNQRDKFFLSHLSISFLIALIAVGVIFFVWYPYPLAQAVGATQLFIMLIAIDVIVGPIMTLLIYKKDLKVFKMDLVIVVIIQMAAFLYGFYSIAQGRPAWIVFNQNKFELVRVNDQFTDNAKKIPKEFEKVSWFGPQYVSVVPSSNPKQRDDDLFMEALGGVSLAQKPERYVPLNATAKKMQQQAQSLKQLELYNDGDKLKKILVKYPQATAYLPIKANKLDMVVLINKREMKVISIVNLRPWN